MWGGENWISWYLYIVMKLLHGKRISQEGWEDKRRVSGRIRLIALISKERDNGCRGRYQGEEDRENELGV